MSGKRQKIRKEPGSTAEGRGEAPKSAGGGSETPMATRRSESLVSTERLMEEICDSENIRKSIQRVKAKRGAPGVDGMQVHELEAYLRAHWPEIREQLLSGTYQPQPVKRVEIPKTDGGVRKLGIPTAIDRAIQQAVLRVLQPRWDSTFSEYSYGFRPERSAHHAIAQAQRYQAMGYSWVVDIDLEKFFDRVNHDRLMARIAARVADKRLLKLIRAFLNAGVMENGLVSPIDEGTPQGGPLSPLLSNLVLDELDRELERRGHRFARYADDCNIYVRSERAGHRVMASITKFITKKLKLKVNDRKSAVARPQERKFLSFSFTRDGRLKRRIWPAARQRLKAKVRSRTRPVAGHSFAFLLGELSNFLEGWRGYFGFCETPSELRKLDSWIRRRLRCLAWRMWKHGPKRYRELRRLGVDAELAATAAGSRLGPWRLSRSPALSKAMPNAYFDHWNLTRLAPRTTT